jgi:carbamoyl-phosphate synthase large subunit
MNVLLTSVGRRVELVRSFRAAYQSLGLEGAVVGIDIEPLAPALHVCDRAYVVPRLYDLSYPKILSELCRRESISLIFPLIDPDIPNLARLASKLEASTGARVASVDAKAADITRDKWLTEGFFRSLGLATPRAWLPGDPAVPREFPLFIKPRKGSASRYTYRIRNARELEFFSSYVPEPIIEEFVAGPEITSDVVSDVNGQIIGVVSRQRIEVRSGEVLKGVTIRDDNIIDACVRIASSLRARGPITVQCIMREGQPVFTEINARLGGGFPLAIAAGFDGPRYLLARAAGIDVAVPPLGEYTLGLYVSRFDDALFLTEKDRDAMASRRI